ncbi:glycolate oxidase subunit GlcE [Methylacidiphilum caldifontis]|uniref:Glycolate dehydrogenase n=1 Tax=Methylacidiphilum caldifontis TaxID=2795386 RepID=A0A4Y8P9P6_9BACT|nr:glycolate oxidase subunit GlcE [Methylacidiphilum caldifontis]TFE67447.1 glycolate dehydrogenase [Methylacidiphilum caldifontis]
MNKVSSPITGLDVNTIQIIEKTRELISLKKKIKIVGGSTKERLGRKVEAEPLDVSFNKGVVEYEPDELFITVKNGTSLSYLEEILKQHGQYLPFEPPHFGMQATVGGSVACGLSGPSRPYRGALKDYLLKVKIINGLGELLSFGSKVIKNVAGFDLFRLMAGAQGTLGIILEATFKVVPLPECSMTVVLEKNDEEALDFISTLSTRCFPLSAGCFHRGKIFIRFSGYEKSVKSALKVIGGEILDNHDQFWFSVKERTHSFFIDSDRIWRFVLPQSTPIPPWDGEWFYDWGGSQRWWKGKNAKADEDLFSWATQAGGYGWLHDRAETLASVLPPALMNLQKRLKEAFDPFGLFNPKRIYKEF